MVKFFSGKNYIDILKNTLWNPKIVGAVWLHAAVTMQKIIKDIMPNSAVFFYFLLSFCGDHLIV